MLDLDLIIKKNLKKIRNEINNLKNRLHKKILKKKINFDLPPKTFWNNLRNEGIINNKFESNSLFTPDEYNNYFSSVIKKMITMKSILLKYFKTLITMRINSHSKIQMKEKLKIIFLELSPMVLVMMEFRLNLLNY